MPGAVITPVDFDRQARYGYGGAASCYERIGAITLTEG
jgi:hypothetical protein